MGYFTAGRGLCQGDPLSPSLFTIFSDLFSRILAKVEEEGKLTGVKISRTSPKISHLMYVDDLAIYCNATPEEALAATDCLKLYSQWTGQEVNWAKSS